MGGILGKSHKQDKNSRITEQDQAILVIMKQLIEVYFSDLISISISEIEKAARWIETISKENPFRHGKGQTHGKAAPSTRKKRVSWN